MLDRNSGSVAEKVPASALFIYKLIRFGKQSLRTHVFLLSAKIRHCTESYSEPEVLTFFCLQLYICVNECGNVACYICCDAVTRCVYLACVSRHFITLAWQNDMFLSMDDVSHSCS